MESKPRPKTLDKLRKRKYAEGWNRIYQQKKDILDKLKSIEEKIKVLEENKTNTEVHLCNPVILKDSKKVCTDDDLNKYNQELKTLPETRENLNSKIKEV